MNVQYPLIDFLVHDIQSINRRLQGGNLQAQALEIDLMLQQLVALYGAVQTTRGGLQSIIQPKAQERFSEPVPSPVQFRQEVPQLQVEARPASQPQRFEEIAPKPEPELPPEPVIEKMMAQEAPIEMKAEATPVENISVEPQVIEPQPEPSAPMTPREEGRVPERQTVNEQYMQQQVSVNDRLKETNTRRNLADKLKLSPIHDLRVGITLNQKIAFIRELFSGDEAEYRRVILSINGMKNHSEAKFFFQNDVAAQRGWNADSPLVQELEEVVYRRFL